MNYQEMSDFEINRLVSAWLFGSVISLDDNVLVGDDNKLFNPCNSWADAGPIIQEYLISLNSRCANGEWKASIFLGREDIFDNYVSAWDKNPLRAAMIVFLLMRGFL